MFGERLREFITKNYVSINTYSRIINVEPANISRYVNGHFAPSQRILKRINDTGCSIDWLMTGKGTMYANNDNGELLKHTKGFENV